MLPSAITHASFAAHEKKSMIESVKAEIIMAFGENSINLLQPRLISVTGSLALSAICKGSPCCFGQALISCMLVLTVEEWSIYGFVYTDQALPNWLNQKVITCNSGVRLQGT